MMDWKHGKDNRSGRYLHVQAGGVLRQVSVGQHDSLALSGGAGGEHDGAEFFRGGLIIEGLLMLFQKTGKREHRSVVFLLLHGNEILQLRAALPDDGRHVPPDLIQNQRLGIGTVHQLAQLFCRKGNIQRHRHIASVYGSKIGDQPGVGGHSRNRHMSSLRQQRADGSGKAFAVAAKLRIAAGSNAAFSLLEPDGIQGTVFFLTFHQNLPDSAAQMCFRNPGNVPCSGFL